MALQIVFTGLRETEPPANLRDRFELIHAPTVEIAPVRPRGTDSLDAFLDRRPRLLFTGVHAVAGFEAWMSERRSPVRTLPGAVESFGLGDAVIESLRDRLSVTARTPERTTVSATVSALAASDEPVLVVSGEGGRPDLVASLQARGIDARDVTVFRTTIFDNAELRRLHRGDDTQVLVLPTELTVRGLLHTIRVEDLGRLASRLVPVGAEAREEIEAAGGEVWLDGERRRVRDILADIVRRLVAELDAPPG